MASPRPATAAGGDVLVRAGTVYTAEAGGPLRPGAVFISGGKVVEVAGSIEPPEGAEVIDLGDGATLLPGLVDADLPGGDRGAERRDHPGDHPAVLAPCRRSTGVPRLRRGPGRRHDQRGDRAVERQRRARPGRGGEDRGPGGDPDAS